MDGGLGCGTEGKDGMQGSFKRCWLGPHVLISVYEREKLRMQENNFLHHFWFLPSLSRGNLPWPRLLSLLVSVLNIYLPVSGETCQSQKGIQRVELGSATGACRGGVSEWGLTRASALYGVPKVP